MFAFAAWLALRLARLRRASESALTRSGLVTAFPETAARDELGDVARSFSTLLARLDEYTSYLRTLAGKLAHELRTPLTIVRSSLENLEAEPSGDAARTYLARARQGSERLNAILLAMGAASRVEEAIGSAERIDFDNFVTERLDAEHSDTDPNRCAWCGRPEPGHRQRAHGPGRQQQRVPGPAHGPLVVRANATRRIRTTTDT